MKDLKRISKFDSFRADELIQGFEEEIEEVKGHLAQITRYNIRYLKELKKVYRKKLPLKVFCNSVLFFTLRSRLQPLLISFQKGWAFSM